MRRRLAAVIQGHGVLLAVIACGVALRLSHVAEPYLADFHAWRQADTAAFAHGYLIDSLSPFDPSIDRYPCEHRHQPFGRVESEWPGVMWVAALPLAALGIDYPPAPYLRAVSIVFFVLTCFYLAALVRKLDGNRETAVVAVAAFSVFPLSIFFTRTVQPDGPALLFATAFLFHLLCWLEPSTAPATVNAVNARVGWRHAAVSGAMACLALLVKISNAFIGVPALFLIVTRRGWLGSLRSAALWVWGICILLPVGAWYWHARGFPWSFGIWADRGASKFSDSTAIGNPELWHRLGERLVLEILTWGGAALLLVGVLRLRRAPSARLALVWLIAVLAFVAATLKGNNRHIYYQLPMVLPAAMLVAHGARVLWSRGVLARAMLFALCVVHGGITREVLWGEGKLLGVTPYFRPDRALIEGIDMVRRHVPYGELFVSSDRHPGLYYNSERRGYFTTSFPGALLHCAEGTSRYLLLERRAQREMERWLKRRPRLAPRLRQVSRGRHYFLWTYEPLPNARAEPARPTRE